VVNYIDQNRKVLLATYPEFQNFKTNFAVPVKMLDDLMALGEKSGVKRDAESVRILQNAIHRQIRALIARDLYEAGTYFQIMTEDDKEVNKAIELLSDQKNYDHYLNR